ncbi:MAG: glycogen/starch synthase [Candidatus Pacebacteria bacterium]|nr:glycogen/starch synthase [Candidatus Paceibacterota bacterium]
MKKKLRILFVTTDLDPFCKAGGLGDVSRDLPKALSKMGYDVRIIMPRHGVIDEEKYNIQIIQDNLTVDLMGEETSFRIKKSYLDTKIPVYFIDKHRYFGSRSHLYGYEDENKRSLFFCKAVLETIKSLEVLEGWKPDIVHCNDWHTGLIPYFIKTEYSSDEQIKDLKTLFTIHNLAFQMGHDWWTVPKKNVDDGQSPLVNLTKKKINNINFSRRAILFADMVNTVSECYAEEIMQEKFGQGLHLELSEKHLQKRFFGIVNGIDYEAYNPRTDPGLATKYNANNFDDKYKNKTLLQKEYGLKVDKDIPLLGMVTRITEQKGFDLLMEVIEPLLRLKLQIIIIGDGDKRYKNFFAKVESKHPRKMVASMQFKRKNVTRIYAASDMFLMPSRFEPCGLGQLISLRYGSVPIVRKTGGLSDTINNYNPKTGKGNGFTFSTYDSFAFFSAIVRAVETFRYSDIWRKIAINGMEESFSWDVPAQKYLALYRKALKSKD